MNQCPHDKFEETVRIHRCGPELCLVEVRVRCAACGVSLLFPAPETDPRAAYLPAAIPPSPPAAPASMSSQETPG